MDTKVWELPESGWYIRFFLWMWNASPQKLNICKLFWGTMFFPLSLFVGIPAAAKRHSVSEPAVLWLILGFLVMCFGMYVTAGMWFFFALFFLLVDLNYHRKAQKTPIEQKTRLKNQDRALNRLTEMITTKSTRLPRELSRLEKALARIDSFIGRVLYRLIIVPMSWIAIKLIGKPALLIIEYAKEAKHKFCPVIVLVPQKKI